MIIGIGSDIVEIERVQHLIERFGARFINHVFTKLEKERAESTPYPAASYAKRFAGKEAVVKALGTGFVKGIALRSIEIENLPGGKPVVNLHGAAALSLEKMVLSPKEAIIHITLSDSKFYAQAFALIEAVEMG